ncbi:unnamed protein product [Dicrocoelium dendriticum]|nr:unnamed protein product [Dicrocoelium dendriticum]
MHLPNKKESCILVIRASLSTELENILQRDRRVNKSSFLSRTFIASILCSTKKSSDQSKISTGSLLTLNTAGAKLEQPALTIWIASSLFVLCLLIGYQIIARSQTCGNRQRNPASNIVVLHPALHIESELRTGELNEESIECESCF